MRSILALAVTSVLVVGCGGGSGGGSAPGSTSTPVAAPAALTSANYLAASQEALSSSDFLSTTTGLATGAQVSDPQVLIRFGQTQFPKLSHWLANAPVQAVGAVVNQTESCAGGGKLTISVDDINGNQRPDVGESVSITATGCSFEGNILNGELIMTLNSLTGNPNSYPYAMTANLQFNDLVAESPSARDVGNGNLAVSIDARFTFDESKSLSTSNFTVAGTYSGVAHSRKLTNYAYFYELTPKFANFPLTTTVKGTLTSSAFGSKSITLETPVPFVRVNPQNPHMVPDPQTYPSSGQMLITGAAGSKVRLTATNATTVLIELDADGNGSYETSTSKPWSEML
jgi:hypothetical protein